jgi:regulator of protease activity HflC (stomatin/prohibitin superfamily)
VIVEPGQVGIVTAQGGPAPSDGRVLAEEGEQGVRRQVLTPGAYRLNPYGYKVELVATVQIKPGFIGVKRRLLGRDGATQFATGPNEKGILKDEIMQPGMYFVNTKEYEVIPCEVGIYQTTYHYAENSSQNTAITFPAKDGNVISLDCTIEWEVLPENWPALLIKYRNLKTIERIVIDQHARKISRDRGFNYGAQDFLDGGKREKFQEDFRRELDKICKLDNVEVRSAFLRNIVIPETFLEQKRLRQLAVETKITSEAQTETALSDAKVAEAKRMIQQREEKVKAETARKVALIERDTENITKLTEAEIEKLKAEYGAKIAELDAEREQALGEARAEAKELKEIATAALYKMKMEIFGRDGDAFLRYNMAQKMNEKMVLRLFQSGPGTLWTNMGNKNMNLMMPVAGGGAAKPDVDVIKQDGEKKSQSKGTSGD